MGSSFHQWLVEAEDYFKHMIQGVFRFVSEGLPTWIYRFFVEAVGPLTIRLCRVLFLGWLWLMILFSPMALACVCRVPGWWQVASIVWVVVAIVGSMWGLHRAAKRRNAGF